MLPNNAIEQVGWTQGDYLDVRVTPKGMLIYKTDPKQKTKQLSYEEFKEAVTRTLSTIPKGCPWSELKLKADLKQRTPSPIWVRRMENERILERVRDHATFRVIWRLSQEQSAPSTLSTLNGWTEKRTGGDRHD